MFWKNKYLQHVLFAFFFLFLGFLGGYVIFGYQGNNISLKPEAKDTVNTVERQMEATIGGMERKIEGRVLYTLCGHWEPLNLSSFSKITSEQLLDRFPEEQGWRIEDTGEKLIITKHIKALCPADEEKRHLGRFGDYVAVIKGPPGIDGGIVEVTDIKLSDLPSDLRKSAEQGTLNFPNAQSILEALDSMDEYEE